MIVPGGSYNQIMERDSERVAITLAAHAFQVFVKFAGLGYPVIRPLIDQRMGVTTEDVTKLVTPQTPPTFIWGSIKDDLTPYLDHIAPYVQALAANQVPFELHEFSTGGHGLALANYYTGIVNGDRTDDHMARWLPLFLEWLQQLAG